MDAHRPWHFAGAVIVGVSVAKYQRLYGRWLGWTGLVACLFLAFWVERQVWAVAAGRAARGYDVSPNRTALPHVQRSENTSIVSRPGLVARMGDVSSNVA